MQQLLRGVSEIKEKKGEKNMNGYNRKSLSENTIYARKSLGQKCIFLSHQKNDAAVCKHIADYLMKSGVDVYFDEYDNDLKIYRQENRPEGVVDSIKKGIQNSTHMLCVVSPNTLFSKWVPWEVGYGYDKLSLSVLTLKGIKDEQLTEYLQTVPIIRGTKSLNEYLSSIAGEYKTKMFDSMRLINECQAHPLDNYLDWNL